MDLLRIGIDISRAIGDAHFNQRLREGNRDANLGMNHFFSCLTQYSLIENTCSKVNEILQNLSFATIVPIPSSLTYSMSLLIPLSLTLGKKSINFTAHPTIHYIITTIDNELLPHVILISNVVAAIAFIVFNNHIYGSVNLLFLILHVMHEKGWMNTDFIQKNRILVGMLEACTITKTLYALIINHSLNPYYLWILADKTYQAVHYIKKPSAITISSMTLREYESKYSETTDIPYRLHEYHLLKKPVSNRLLEDLTNELNQYATTLRKYLEQDLSTHTLPLLHKFRNEDRWQQDYNNNPLEYLHHGINRLLHAIQRSNNSEFKNKSLYIIRYILNLPEDEKMDKLATLAISGHYCPERLYSDVNVLYDTYIDTFESRALSNKVISLLHGDRLQILDQILAGINEVKSLLNSAATLPLDPNEPRSISQRLSSLFLQVLSFLVPPMDDIHFANSMKNILCPYLYVHHKSIDTLTEINREELSWSLFNWFYQKNGFISLMEFMFSQQYHPKIVFKRISDIIQKEPTISTLEIEQWFIEQYMSEYTEANRSIAEEWVREKVYTIDDDYIPKIKPYYMLFFLVNQGVLKIEDSPDFDKRPQRSLEIITTLFSPDSLEEGTAIEG